MQIGKPIRKFVVEPLECPVPAAAPDPEPEKAEPVVPAHRPEPESVREPVEL